jgi:hypothetical protein
MAESVLSVAYQMINLGKLAPMVPLGTVLLQDNWEVPAEEVANLVYAMDIKNSQRILDMATEYQPLGEFEKEFSTKEKILLTEKRLHELGNKLKMANQTKSFEMSSLKKVFQTLAVSAEYLKDKEFFENRSNFLQSSNPYGRFMG